VKAVLMQFVDRILIAAGRLMPPGLMRHWLWLIRKDPQISDAWGFHIRPIHYYEPLPDFRTVAPSLCNRRRDSPGIDFALTRQVALLNSLALQSRAELNEIVQAGSFDFANSWFTGPDACTYYALVRHLKPRRIVEIGAGYSTRIASLAIARNDAEGRPSEITCIEPNPDYRLTEASASFKLIAKPVQDVPLSLFDELSENDILMIDSSHVATIGSDVCYEFLDIVPRLKPGVWVHVHDIYFPTDYPPAWVIAERRAYNEQYLLEAFLSGNNSFAPRLAIHWLALDHRGAIDALCPPESLSNIAPEQLGSSFWMRRDR